MLEYRKAGDGTFQARQYFRRPAVYLDHWAFRRFSEDPENRQALADAIADREGMLTIGRLNLLEFTRVTNFAQVHAAEELLQAVLPRIFFLDVQIMDVVQRENARELGACGDAQLFEYFGAPLLGERQEWRAANLFERLDDRKAEYREGFEAIERKVLATLNSEYSNVDARTIRQSLKEAAARPHATLGLVRAIVGEIYRDKTRPLEQSDATDLMHAVVPCAYCDFALLDSEWRDYVGRARRRLPGRQHVASVYSQRHDGIGQFLRALRAYPKDLRGPPPWLAPDGTPV